MTRRLWAFAALWALTAAAGERYPGRHWDRVSNPEKAGWSSEKLAAARATSEKNGSAAVMIVADGRVVDAWGEVTRKYMCHSMRKSLLSALYGIHVEAGRIRLDKTLGELGIDDVEPALTAAEKRATVRMLLQARSGVYHAALYETPAMRASRPKRGSHPPGTFWYYNNWDFNALGTIFERETGKKIFEELRARIARPTGMEDFRVEDGEYFRGADSIHPAYPLRMSARDLARFGLLYARGGKWKGRQVVPAAWVKESVSSWSDAGRSGGYGYMWWVAANGRHLPGAALPEGSFSARGAGGHYVLAVPALDVVIVHRVDTDARKSVSDAQFGALVNLILEAKVR